MALLAKNIPQGDGRCCQLGRVYGAFAKGFAQLFTDFSGLRKAGKVAFDVGHENWYPDVGKPLGQRLQGDGFASAGGASDEPVAVGLVRAQKALGGGFARSALGNEDAVKGAGCHRSPEKYNLRGSVTNF